MSSSNFKKSNGGKRKGRGNGFDSVPADDGFRNYMARKIELQRKQFGLVIPPPPPPPSPPQQPHRTPQPEHPPPRKILKKAKYNERSDGKGIHNSTPKSADSSLSLSSDDGVNPESEKKKSVRFHQSLDIEGVSQVLDNLKQRHSAGRNRGRSAYKRRRRLTNNRTAGNGVLVAEDANPPSNGESVSSILGVLDNLQKRYGASSSTKGRSSSDSKSRKRSFTNNPPSVLESLQPGDDGGSVPSFRERISDKVGESPRCKGVSILEEIVPTIDKQDEQNNNDHIQEDCSLILQEQFQEYPANNDDLMLAQMTPKSPPSDILESPIMRDEECDGCKPSPELNPKQPQIDRTKPASKYNPRPDLFFTGVVVLVNGHTSPDATTLMRLLHRHGGDLEKYETRRVTHIIAEQLSAAKANIYKRQKKPIPVCHPEWITDSIERGKLLPHGEYLLKDVRDNAGTRSVRSFFKPNQDDAEGQHQTDKFAEKECSHRWQDSHPSKANYQLNGQVRTVGNDPNFLDSYFSNSRLSYIGSYQQRVKSAKSASAPPSPSKKGAKKFVLLVDMDCFFAAVALRKYPQYRNKPVAVGHAHSAKSNVTTSDISAKTYSKNSSSELSTCNYIAREHGVRKGMFLGDAIRKCPDLIVLPYDFKGYEEVSGIVAEQLHGFAEQYNGVVEQVSCDEMYVEINLLPGDYPDNDVYSFVHRLAEHIRADIVKKTECTASIGIGPNKLLAKLSADKVKPNACCVVQDWREFLADLSLRDIPGIGRKFQKKLQPHGLCTVNDVWHLDDNAVKVISEILGSGTAQKIVNFCYGKDDRPVTPAVRKSIGAECNYGVRFDGPYGVDYMMQGLAKEVEKRMTGAGVKGTKLVLKVMRSKDASKVPGKFLGHGLCDSLSRSANIPLTRNKDNIYNAALRLFDQLGVDKSLVRGMGIVINSLKYDDEPASSDSSPSKLSKWLKVGSAQPSIIQEMQEETNMPSQSLVVAENADGDNVAMAEQDRQMEPTFSQLDQDVLHSLPADILSEVKSMYGKQRSSQETRTSRQVPLKSSTLKNAAKGSKREKPIAISGQVSVKRMLKLACIKSGEETLAERNVSLTQLDCLPIEVQLQIANGDDIKIVKSSKSKIIHSTMPQSRASTHGSIMDDQSMPDEKLDTEAQYKGSQQDNCTDNFYHNNIAPLQDFISSNPNPTVNAVDTVKNFLLLCINEKRIEDVVTFLRTMRNMNGGWSTSIYSQLKEISLSEIHSATGNVLDTRWLGL